MKTKGWTLTVLVVLIAAIGYSTEIPKMNIVKADKQKALVAYKANFNTTLEITLTNNEGEILYFKKTKKPQSEYTKIFDFAELGNGKYHVCINYGNQSINRELTVTKKKLEVGPTKRMYEPYLKIKDQNLTVSHLNLSKKNVYLNIYNKGEYVSGVNLGKQKAIQKCINMSALKKGDYEVVVTDRFKNHRFFVQL